MRSYNRHICAALTLVALLFGLEGSGMMVASRNSFTVQTGNAEEEMYKDLLIRTVGRGFTQGDDIDWDFIDTVGAYGFSNCTVGDIVLPNVTTAGKYAFSEGRVYGNTVSFPSLVAMADHAFANNIFQGGTISLPSVTSLNATFYQFIRRINSDYMPTTLALDSVTTISNGAFYNCNGIRRMYAPRVMSIIGSATFLSVGRRYCGDVYPTPAVDCELVVGSSELGTGLTMDALMALANFPFGAIVGEYSPTWYCKDGTVTYDTVQGAWVQTPYS